MQHRRHMILEGNNQLFLSQSIDPLRKLRNRKERQSINGSTSLLFDLAVSILQTGSWVERVAQAVADVVDTEHSHKDHQTGPEHHVGCDFKEVFAVIEQAAPSGGVRREAEAQER